MVLMAGTVPSVTVNVVVAFWGVGLARVLGLATGNVKLPGLVR